MKTVAAILTIVLALALPMQKAEAHVVVPVALLGAGADDVGPWMFFPALALANAAFLANIYGVDPWTGTFPVVDRTYPGDKPKATQVALSNKGWGKPYHTKVNGVEVIQTDPL